MSLGERLKEARANAGITQREVAKRAGMNYKTLSNWENDVSKPSPEDILTLARIYGITTDEILGNQLIEAPSKAGNSVDIWSVPPPSYYNDPEVARIAQEMHDNPGIRVLFDASRGLKKESIEEIRKFIEFQRAKEEGL